MEHAFSESNGTDGGPALRFSFNESDIINDRNAEREKIRNFRPMCVNKNVCLFGQLIDKSNQYWDGTQLEPAQERGKFVT